MQVKHLHHDTYTMYISVRISIPLQCLLHARFARIALPLSRGEMDDDYQSL